AAITAQASDTRRTARRNERIGGKISGRDEARGLRVQRGPDELSGPRAASLLLGASAQLGNRVLNDRDQLLSARNILAEALPRRLLGKLHPGVVFRVGQLAHRRSGLG